MGLAQMVNKRALEDRKLTMEQASEIRVKYIKGIRPKMLMLEYGISKGVLNGVLQGRTYTPKLTQD